MKKLNNYSIGVDIGIGSVGIAAVDNENGRILEMNSRLFDSGEKKDGKDRDSQVRRGYRGQRRRIRRRHHRKERLKYILEQQGIVSLNELDKWYKSPNEVYNKILSLNLEDKYTTRDFYPLRAIALDYQLTGNELAAVLIHMCNHRGYNPFYDFDDDDKEAKTLQKQSNTLKEIMVKGNYRTVGEMYALDGEFKNPNPSFSNYGFIYNRNRKDKPVRENFHLVLRSQIKEEAKLILDKQSSFFPQLNNVITVKNQETTEQTTVKQRIFDIMFSQRDFEDGPSFDPNSKSQKYHGLTIENVGNCMYYPTEKRGVRASVIGDLFATTNLLSQYTYVNTETGEIGLYPECAKEIVSSFVKCGELTNKSLKKILKKYNMSVNTKTADTKDTLGKCNKFTKRVKKIFDECNISWDDFIGDNVLSVKNKAYKLAQVLAYNVTPRRRVSALKELGYLSDEAINMFEKNYGGTSNVSDKFMIKSIEAFERGEIYGDFQARMLKERFDEKDKSEKYDKIPLIKDIDMIKNPVVFRSLNETRKMVNAVIEKYGTPANINVEVASELNKSAQMRKKTEENIKNNEKNNDICRHEIAKITGQSVNSVTKNEIDRYKLYQQQEGKCLYSGKEIKMEDMFGASYEVDHIIPYSLVLDDTLSNKCLVLRKENQLKKQRTPLQYFDEEHLEEQKQGFINRVNSMCKKEKNLKQKYAYLMTPNIYIPDLMEQWKSRNLNDTRYITKYAVNMISQIKTKTENGVIPIKGGITSLFRKWWLVGQKSSIEEYEYIEKFLREHRKRINDINYEMNKKDEDNSEEKTSALKAELDDLFNICIEDMEKNYGFDRNYTKMLLENNLLEKNREKTVLHHGVDAVILAVLNKKCIELALDNNKLFEIWRENRKIRESYGEFIKKFKVSPDDSIPQFYEYLKNAKEKMRRFYHMDENKAQELLLNPYRITNNFTRLKDEVLVRTIDHDQKLFERLTHELYDNEFADSLSMPLVSRKIERKFSGQITDDMPLKKSSDKVKNGSALVKQIGDDNVTYMNGSKYYCVEVYENDKGKTAVRGIKMSDVVKKNKKLMLRCPLPEDYKKHIMYLFKNEYIEIYNKKGLKMAGFYQSVENINQGYLCFIKNNNARAEAVSIAQKDIFKKYYVNLLGGKGGEIKCGEPLSLMTPKD